MQARKWLTNAPMKKATSEMQTISGSGNPKSEIDVKRAAMIPPRIVAIKTAIHCTDKYERVFIKGAGYVKTARTLLLRDITVNASCEY